MTCARARDTKVGRTVALMRPPPQLLTDAPRRAFRRVRVAGTLNHPNIAALFDVVEEDGITISRTSSQRDHRCVRRCPGCVSA